MPPALRPECLLAAVLSSSEDGALCFSLNGIIQTWSEGAARLYGYSASEITGQPLTLLLPISEIPPLEQYLRTAKEAAAASCESAERLRRDGSTFRVHVKRVPVRDGHGEIAGVVEMARADDRQRYILPDDLQLRLLLEQMPVVLWTTDRFLRITSNWGAGFGSSKAKPGELAGRTLHEYLKCQDPHAAPISQHAEVLRGVPSHFEYQSGDQHFAVHLSPLRDASGQITGCIGAEIDITERKRCEDQIRHQATHDALTELANYRAFVDTLEQEVRRAGRSSHSFAVLLLDMDDLKRVNDRFGHLAGNCALKRLSQIIKQHCRSTDLAARYGGDEFAVVLLDADPAMARRIAERVESALRKDRERPALSVSIGIGVYPEDGQTAQELLQAADRQLYKRKKGARTQGITA